MSIARSARTIGRERPSAPPDPPPRRTGPSPALRAAPRGIGSAGARDPLAREVRLLGALLGQVIIEQEGLALFELVERVRRDAIAARRSRPAAGADRALPDLDRLTPAQAERLARAFTIYFLLTNLAEEKHRIRVLARRERTRRQPLDESVADAVRRWDGEADLSALVERMRLQPVLTAHPTEARRRTVLLAQRRIRHLLDRFDDPRLTPRDDDDLRRRLLVEISTLWRTALVRDRRPQPLDEVRAAMTFFDETIFDATPDLYRRVEAALDSTRSRRTPAHPPRTPAFLRWGSWIGGDRDGHPGVTADVTLATLRIQSDHLLRGYQRVAHRLLEALSIRSEGSAPLDALLSDAAARLPAVAVALDEHYPGQPYRVALGLIGERIGRTHTRLTDAAGPTDGAYATPIELQADLATVQAALEADGLAALAWGDVQDLVWQVETFGFHLASLEIRQHAAVHRAARTCLEEGGDRDAPLGPNMPSAAEVLASLHAAVRSQATVGPDACRRYVISFTRRPDDALDLLALAREAVAASSVPLDVVPLLESSDALGSAGAILAELLADPGYRAHLSTRGDRQEVMLGYSDANKELGYLAAAWALHRAQEQLVDAARAAGIELTLFHGRGGAIGRGGGPAARAILAQAPGSVDGRLKLTEQGEVIAARYADRRIAGRHLEQLTHALLLASRPSHGEQVQAATARWRAMMDELAAHATEAYAALVNEPGFEAFFRSATPIAELSGLYLGSRPARRGAGELRAIPWVFAWAQSRANLPAWYGAGSAMVAYRARHEMAGLHQLAGAYREWPFFASTIDNLELGLAIADRTVARHYAGLAADAEPMRRIAARIDDEHRRTVEELLRMTGRRALLEDAPRLQRSIELRNPYVDALSALQVQLLDRIRLGVQVAERGQLEHCIGLTVNGIAAGLQHTG